MGRFVLTTDPIGTGHVLKEKGIPYETIGQSIIHLKGRTVETELLLVKQGSRSFLMRLPGVMAVRKALEKCGHGIYIYRNSGYGLELVRRDEHEA